MKITENMKIAIVCVIIALTLILYIFGFIGIKSIIGALLLFFLPAYLILSSFKLDEDETIILSFFTGLGIYALIVYYINRAIPSLRMSMVVVWVALMAIGILLRTRKSKQAVI